MNGGLLSSPAGEAIVGLTDFEFNWVKGPEGDNDHKGSITYNLNISPATQDDGSIDGFCEIRLARTGYKFDNFEIFARYYYGQKTGASQPRNRRTWERNLARGVIWTKFAELARMAAVNAGSNPYDIPLLPDKVHYEE
jgi:hypothetical protein